MNGHYKFVNNPLPYSYDAMEPFIDEKTMRLHHDKHLQTYIDNLNKTIVDYPEFQNMTLEELLLNLELMPEEIRVSVHNNAGGVYNHRLYFSNLKNSENKEPVGKLAEYINRIFGSYDLFKKKMKDAALSVFGSGYAWLAVGKFGILKIVTTQNQDTPLPYQLCPILNLDVWEHAYYLKHYNVRADYIDDWFKVVNWEEANEKYLKCLEYGNFRY